jgi:hypothetical protein
MKTLLTQEKVIIPMPWMTVKTDALGIRKFLRSQEELKMLDEIESSSFEW